MGRFTRLLATLAVAAILTAMPLTALAQDFSAFHTFIGRLTLDGEVPPAATEVSAYDGTRSIGTALSAADGTYALQTTEAFGTIMFTIDGVETDQTFANWRRDGRTTGFNLTATTPLTLAERVETITGPPGPQGPAGPAGSPG